MFVAKYLRIQVNWPDTAEFTVERNRTNLLYVTRCLDTLQL